jgi:hypothetical protein
MKILDMFANIRMEGGGAAEMTLKGLLSSSMAAKAALVATSAALYQMSNAAREAALNYERFEAITGKSADELQELQYQAAQAGVAGEEIAGVVKNLQRLKVNVQLGRGMPAAFMLLGIDPAEDPVKMLETLRGKIGQLKAEEAAAITSELGISENTFYFLSKSADEFDRLNKKFLLTKGQRETLVKLHAAFQKIWFVIKNISAQFQAMSAAFQVKFLNWVSDFIERMYDLALAVNNWLAENERIRNILLVIAGIAAVMFLPFAKILAVITLLALAVEDVFTYFQGGDSITGMLVEWVKSSETLSAVWDTLKGGVDAVVSLFKLAWTYLQGIWEMAKDLAESPFMKFVGKWASKGAGALLKGYGNLFAAVKDGADNMAAANNSALESLRANGGGIYNNTTNGGDKNVNIYNNFQNGGPAEADTFGQQVSDALYESPALAGGGGR